MNDNPTPIAKIMPDLSWAMESGSEYGYRLNGDRIEVEEYSDDGMTVTTIGYLTFTEVTP